jgi:c-di-GMP-binding flagellar brake protein YcgR
MFNRRWIGDRRRFQRLKVNLSVWYKIISPVYLQDLMGGKEIEAITVDLSRAGISLITDYRIPAWSVLSLKFILFKTDNEGLVSFSDPVEVIGEVRSSILLDNHYRLGVCFKQIKTENGQEISNFVGSTYKH